MSNASDLGTDTAGSAGPYGGYTSTYGAFALPGAAQGAIDIPYQGYNTNYGGQLIPSQIGESVSLPYEGFIGNYGGDSINGANDTATLQTFQEDNQMVYPFPKDQQIYYKLSGYNGNTLSYETWVIAEEIVPHLEQFEPTHNPPSVDLNVFFAPPSGNILTNIRIVGRWIQ